MSAAIVPVGGKWRSPSESTAAPAALKPAEIRAVVAALEHADQGDAARAARLALRTYQRTIARPHVREAITAGAMERLRRITLAVSRHAERAVDLLGEMARGTTPATSPRVRAAVALIEAGQRARATEDQEERLSHIEKLVAEMGRRLS
jgi:hypothetical protein